MTSDRPGALPHHLLKAVERPARYLGGEINAARGQRSADFTVCLLFPDCYDVGIAYYGFQILYHILNRMEGVGGERAYLPMPDMQRLLRQTRRPLTALESGRPLAGFDLVGITLQTELHYPGVVKALDLAGIPRFAADRSADDPLVIGGGPCAYHPEPVAPFFDAFLLGDAEEALPALTLRLRALPWRTMPRVALGEALTDLPGLYLPGLYRPDPAEPAAVIPLNGAPRRVRGETLPTLRREYYPDRPLVPLVKGAHDRLVVEIMRGCTHGCRFCQAGMIHRPVRQRPAAEIIDYVVEGLAATGYDEVGLLSLSTGDYHGIEALLGTLAERLAGRRATLSFPSLRPATFSEEIARIRTGGRRTTQTFAVEAGSERLRRVINKQLTDAELLEATERAFRHGWRTVKLYLMTGLPTEDDDDLDGGATLLAELKRTVPPGRTLRISVAPFIPKPQTVFEREAYQTLGELERRRRLLTRGLGGKRAQVVWHDPVISRVEALLSRGDRRLAPVIAEVADAGEGLEGWSQFFSAERWDEALARHLPGWRGMLEALPADAPLPWDHLTKGIARSFRRRDREAALRGELLPDCRNGECPECGLGAFCPSPCLPPKALSPKPNCAVLTSPELDGVWRPAGRLTAGEPIVGRYRVTFAKLRAARLLGHNDLMRTLLLALCRAGAPIRYHGGAQPRPVLSFAPALPLGVGGLRLWLEFDAGAEVDAVRLKSALRRELPPGIRVWSVEPAPPSVANGRLRYSFRLASPFRSSKETCPSTSAEVAGLPDGWRLSDSRTVLCYEMVDGASKPPTSDLATALLAQLSADGTAAPVVLKVTKLN